MPAQPHPTSAHAPLDVHALADIRHRKRITVPQLAQLTGHSQWHLYKVGSGAVPCTWDTYRRIRDALDLGDNALLATTTEDAA